MAEPYTYQARLEAERESCTQLRAEARKEHVAVATRQDGAVVLTTVDPSGRLVAVELGYTHHAQLMSDLFAAWEARKS